MMDSRGHIYRAPEDEIPTEDKARLDGYLLARAEHDERSDEQQLLAALEALENANGPAEARP